MKHINLPIDRQTHQALVRLAGKLTHETGERIGVVAVIRLAIEQLLEEQGEE